MAMAAADIGIVTLGVGTEGISVPSKTYINLAAGSCILAIAPADSELTRLITEYQAGIVCNPGNPSSLAQAVTELLSDNDLLTRYKENALKASKLFTPQNAKEYIRVVVGAT
jgi:glycosyltransferase involved in cell wall biosynthesis